MKVHADDCWPEDGIELGRFGMIGHGPIMPGPGSGIRDHRRGRADLRRVFSSHRSASLHPRRPARRRARGISLIVVLKTPTVVAAERLAEVLRSVGLARRTIVNVKSHDQAAVLRSGAPGLTIMAQPDWIADATTATDIDIVLVWGAQLPAALRVRPAAQIGLFQNVLAEAGIPDLTTWERARTERSRSTCRAT